MATRRSPLTPQFEFDDATGQYRHIRSGRFVSGELARSALDDYYDAKAEYAIKISEQLRNREISFATWQGEFERTLAKIHLVSIAQARGGWHRMTSADYGRAGQLYKQELIGIKGQHRGLRGLVADMQKGKPLDGHWMQRIQQYVQAGRHSFHVAETIEMERRGADEECSIRAVTDSCDECIEQEDLKWQKIKSKRIKQPGDRRCKRRCKCRKKYRNSKTGQVFG